jgi:hypothetical protein
MKSLFFAALLTWSAQALAQESEPSYTLRAGTLIHEDKNFVLVGVGLQIKTSETWNLEASADMALSNGLNLPSDENGLFGTFPLSLSGVYHPFHSRLSPFLQLGGGVNLITNNDPNPFLHGGAGASYRTDDWALHTDFRYMFLPGEKADPIDEQGLQMTVALQREF